MLKKVRDKLGLKLINALYGKHADISCSFYGPEASFKCEIFDSTCIGVVFQGPVVDEYKLLAGLTHYRKLLPDSCIVLSTWENNIKSNLMQELKRIKVSYIESKPPSINGIMNVNRQIVSTAAGIKILQNQVKPDFIIKTRTDYFPWRPDRAIQQIKTLSRFLIESDRIWGIDFNTRMDLPFSFSDILQIGPANLMRDYWRTDGLYPADVSTKQFLKLTDQQRDIEAILRLQPAEIFLARRYLVGRGCTYDFSSLKDYHDALVHWFGILDSHHIELAFGKYSLALPGYEPLDLKRKRFVKSQDWLTMFSTRS